MATGSTIVVEVPSNKIGKTYQFPKEENEFETPSFTIPEGTKFIEVYHHFDGYPKGLGAELTKEHTDFDEIMTNVIAGGDMSAIGTPYHAWRNEEWEDVQPKCLEEIPNRREAYQYLFKAGDNRWYVRGDKTGFKKVSEVLSADFDPKAEK